MPPAPETAGPGSLQRSWLEGALRPLERGWMRLDGWVEGWLPAAWNPFAQLGAMANGCLLAAVISGILLLVWYTPSLGRAHGSMEALREGSGVGQLVRSVHRYSSDGCMLFMVLHVARILCQRRFNQARWLAWVTGVLMFAAVGFIGWTGYWLVWDTRAQHAALGTVRFLDAVPIFAEPMARSFLTDEGVPSLLFFLIFFAHILLPLSVGIGLWLHLSRLQRPRLFTNRGMALWLVGALVVAGLLAPATSAAPARMRHQEAWFRMDWWYLWPFALTDRLGGGALWGLWLAVGGAGLGVPWWLGRARPSRGWKAEVDLPRCFGCTLCSHDCPFTAISMVPRGDGAKFALQSRVDPALCVSCGVCVGACDSQAIHLPGLDTRGVEAAINAGIDVARSRGEKPWLVYCCAEADTSALQVQADGSCPGVPGVLVRTVPCVSWVSAVMLERPLRRGVEGIRVIACGGGDPAGRDGCRWFEERLAGRREPAFNPSQADPSRVRLVHLARVGPGDLRRLVAAPSPGEPPSGPPTVGSLRGWGRYAAASALTGLLGVAMWGVSIAPYHPPVPSRPELVVSFSHPGALAGSRRLTPEELAKRLPHMRAQVEVTRGRVPVRLRVTLDGHPVHDQAYPARGLSADGPSVAVVRLPVEPGVHPLVVELADGPDPGQFPFRWAAEVEFTPGDSRVVLFDSKGRFTLH